MRGAGTGGHLRGAGTGGHLRGAGTGGHLRGAGTGGRCRGAGTGEHLRGSMTSGLAIFSAGGLAILIAGRLALFSAGRLSIFTAGGRCLGAGTGFAAGGGGLGRVTGGSGLRRMELLRRQGGSLRLGRRRSRWRGMRRFSVWDELGRRGAFQLERDDETGEFPQLLSRNPFKKRTRLISSIRGKSPMGRSQRIVSSSNPSRKHAPRAASCQLIRLEISRNSSTYLSNLRPPCRNPHSASSAEVIGKVPVFCHGVLREPGTRRRGTSFKLFIFPHTEIMGDTVHH